MIRLTKSQILLLHEQLITETGGSSGLRDEGMLDSALNAPFQTLPLVKRICIRLFSKRQLGFASVLSKTIHLWTGISESARTPCWCSSHSTVLNCSIRRQSFPM